MNPSMRHALIPLADGVEEMEAVITIDVLRRAGWEVRALAAHSHDPDRRTVRAARGVQLVADGTWSDTAGGPPADALVIPGGAPGTAALCAHAGVLETVRQHHAGHRIVAAICAGPKVLLAAGILAGRRIACHPAVRAELAAHCTVLDQPVVIDGTVVTSQGPGTTMAYALTLVALLDGQDAAAKLAAAMVYRFTAPIPSV